MSSTNCNPSLIIAGPALQALRFACDEDSLRELYANLLATAMDSATAAGAHPSFVGVLTAMSPDEAKIMRLFVAKTAYPVIDLHQVEKSSVASAITTIAVRNFSFVGREAGCMAPELTQSYLDNLCRLGLLEMPFGTSLAVPNTYEQLENASELECFKEQILSRDKQVRIERRVIRVTDFGRLFCSACVADRKVL